LPAPSAGDLAICSATGARSIPYPGNAQDAAQQRANYQVWPQNEKALKAQE
jgi:hypothetical protein